MHRSFTFLVYEDVGVGTKHEFSLSLSPSAFQSQVKSNHPREDYAENTYA